MSAKSFVNGLYLRCNTIDDKFQRSCLYYYIIQIKSENLDIQNEKESLYKDIKLFLGNYITFYAENRGDYGYDTLNLNKILKAIKSCDGSSKRLSLSNYAKSLLDRCGFYDLSQDLNKQFKYDYIKTLWNNGYKGKIVTILSLPFYNLYTCIGLVLFVFFVNYVATLPMCSKESAWFIIQEETPFDNKLLNHLYNLLCSFVNLNEKTFCRPNGWKGFVAILGFKLTWALAFSGVLLKYIKNRMHLGIIDYD